jgi:hypothetical protein
MVPQTTLPLLDPPESLNYIAAFLTLGCNLNCSYCINDPQQAGERRGLFRERRTTMTPQQWIEGLSRIPVSDDLPITLQGGEPTVYRSGRGIGEMLSGLPHWFDLLTNFAMPTQRFVESLGGHAKHFMRPAPYPAIRVSYHAEEMERVWHNRGFEELVDRCEELAAHGFKVSADKSKSDVGIYMVDVAGNELTERMRKTFEGRVPFETKPFLGVQEGQLHGSYKYLHSTDLISRELWPETLSCECRTSELLLDPLGFVWGCHFHLYENWVDGGPEAAFEQLEANQFRFHGLVKGLFDDRPATPIGHLLDPEFSLQQLQEFRACNHYGRCIGCDTKIKNNRFESIYSNQ